MISLILRCVLFELVTLFLLALPAHADIFGKDNRRWPESRKEIELSRAVAVGVLTGMIDQNFEGLFDIFADSMSDHVCLDEKFSSEPSIAYACTGFLIAPDLLITAGHCATNFREVFNSDELYCKAYAWMFDYVETQSQQALVENVSGDKIYQCKEIIYAVADDKAPYRDFALIRLDREVSDRGPLSLSWKTPKRNDEVSMLGTPMGMPVKYVDGARVLSQRPNKKSFLTDLDAFQGNSGSPVFNSADQVVGVLVSGSPSISTYRDPVAGCDRYNSCDEQGMNCKFDHKEVLVVDNRHGSEVEKLRTYRSIIKAALSSR